MSRPVVLCLTILVVGPGLCFGQASGNIAYSQGAGKAKAEQNERNKRVLTEYELPPTSTSTFVEANVLMNVKADEYVAVFGISQEGDTPADCRQQMDDTIQKFIEELEELEIDLDALFIDFVAQNRIYGYEIKGDIAQEQLVGFELKKNVMIPFQDYKLLDEIVLAAARVEVFDLIKVDYVVKDISGVQDRLMEEAARIIKQKAARYEKLLDIKLQPPAQVFAERSATYYPSELYDSYTAFESEGMGSNHLRQKYTIQTARKSQTFFFNGLDADGFDHVIQPVIVEPVVQCTLYLKVKYEVEQSKAR